MLNEKAIRAACEAHDREEAAQKGEPSPWDANVDADDPEFVSERMTAMECGVEALFASLPMPEPVAWTASIRHQRDADDGGDYWETKNIGSRKFLESLAPEYIRNVRPLYPAESIAALQAENERLRAELLQMRLNQDGTAPEGETSNGGKFCV